MGSLAPLTVVTILFIFISVAHAAIVPQASFADHNRETTISNENLGKGPVADTKVTLGHDPIGSFRERNNRTSDIPPEKIGLGPVPQEQSPLPAPKPTPSSPLVFTILPSASPEPEPTTEAQETAQDHSSHEGTSNYWPYWRYFNVWY